MFNRESKGRHNAVIRRILGANSVTNIDSGRGYLPAPMIRNAIGFANNPFLLSHRRRTAT
ncbi:hypothetical protein F4W70_28055 [Pseudomonas cannabina]|nr:hypothetical protein F4W70_28055 [Pseudomonas cannabina]